MIIGIYIPQYAEVINGALGDYINANFSIGLKSGILDGKHMDNMGQSIWLFLWMLDRQPRSTDKVSGGKPITYQDFAADFPSVSRRTYLRWLEMLETHKYIITKRTPRGLSIRIAKAKKWKIDVPKMSHYSNTDMTKLAPRKTSDVPKMSHAKDVPKMSHAIKTNNKNKQVVSISSEILTCEHVKKLYYDCIKSYGIPITNHNVLRSKINEMCKQESPDNLINYLNFMLTHYREIDLEFKPHITDSLDFFRKRIQIREILIAAKKQQLRQPNVWRPQK